MAQFKHLVSTQDGAALAVSATEQNEICLSVMAWEQSRPTFANLTDLQAELLARHILDYLACKARTEQA
jgi:hypothetical protein